MHLAYLHLIATNPNPLPFLHSRRSKKKLKLDDTVEDAELEAYEIYRKMKADQIKDFFRWNDQIVGGNKDVLVARAIDLHVNGRMMRCNECGGKWKQSDKDEDSLVCSGGFDETIGARVEVS